MEPNQIFKRPNPSDSEDDLIKFQNLFLAEKSKNTNFQPAAKVIRLTNADDSTVQTPKISQFAKKRGLMKEQPAEQTKNHSKLILGDIVEKLDESHSNVDRVAESNQAFPTACRIDRSTLKNCDGTKSLFAMSHAKRPNQSQLQSQMQSKSSRKSFGESSSILNENDAKSIHDENVQILNSLDETEILAERQQILDTIDPGLLRFIQSKRKQTNPKEIKTEIEQTHRTADPDLSSIELLSHPNVHNWPHFDIVESEKLEWMKDISNTLPKLEPGQSYEARFDWKGVLLPYFSPETDSDRDLFLHESDAQRPGYTLQELFRLARSNVTQQRSSAVGAISGILNIYNQGFYDKILEVPISKIFFLLRFAFDDNTIFLLETTSKALATLFYNDSDEFLLDCTHECAARSREPTLGFVNIKKEQVDLNEQFAKMDMQEKQTFHSVFNDDEDTSSLNDFHLAETNMIECLLRTNILQRIRYILFVMRTDNSTVINCLKILIRLARTDKETAAKIYMDSGLLQNCIQEFLPHADKTSVKTQFYQKPQYMLLKLLRIIAAYELPIWELDIEDILKSYIYTRSDMSIDFIKVQIESFRLVKTICLLKKTNELYSELVPAFQYLLEWYYNFVKFDQLGGHSMIRQHASALISLIGCKSFSSETNAFPDRLSQCISKWFHSATLQGIQEFSQITLLSSSLVTLSRLQGYDQSDFLKQYLTPFLKSNCYKEMCSNLCKSSPLLCLTSQRLNRTESLPDLDVVHFTNESPTLIVGEKYPIFVLNGIVAILATLENNDKLFNNLMKDCMNDILLEYLKKLSVGFNVNVRKNWFVRNELSFIVKLLKFKDILKVIDNTTVQKIAFNVMCCCTENELEDLLFILSKIVFNVALYDHPGDVFQSDMDKWYGSYLLLLGPIEKQTNSLVHAIQSEILIPNDWFWLPLLIFLNIDQKKEENVLERHSFIKNLKEKDIIQMTLKFTYLQKRNFLTFITPTEELMFLMISFMGPDTTFLETDICELLAYCVEDFFKVHNDTTFDFDQKFEGKGKFENLYVLFLDHFQGTSYGNETFSSLVMVPLAQKYDVKWRKMIWSEHAIALRFISCREDHCIGSIENYLYPIESDKSLLKCYYQALSSILREGSLPYKIAKHHLDNNKIITNK